MIAALEYDCHAPILMAIVKQKTGDIIVSQDPKELDELQEDQVELNHASDEAADEPNAATDHKEEENLSGPDALLGQIESLKSALQDSKEQFLRAQAEMHNIQRRASQDVEKAHKFGLEKFVTDVLPVADNLERAILAAKESTGNLEAITEGVELTLKSLLDALRKHQVEQVDPVGEPFNPELHQAMTTVPNPDVEPNTVVDVFQRGYTLNGRLVRPAMVVVAKS